MPARWASWPRHADRRRDRCRHRRTKDLTDRPFGATCAVDAPDVIERARLLVRHGVKVASFALAPTERVIRDLKEDGLTVRASIGARRHAEKVAAWGVDALIVQGGEGGGHTGSVPDLDPAGRRWSDAVDLPVIAAGGFSDGRGLVAALAYGAAGIAMGTRFLLNQRQPGAGLGQGGVPQANGQRHRRDVRPGRRATARAAHLSLLTSSSAPGRRRACWRSVAHAVAFQKLSGTPLARHPPRGGRDEAPPHLTWAQVIMAAIRR